MSQYIPVPVEIVDIDIESPNTYLISLKLFRRKCTSATSRDSSSWSLFSA